MNKILKRFKEEPIKCIFYIFSISLIVFFLGSILITHGESVKYYLFADRQDTFMDFFNSIYDTIGRRPYDMGVIYPPLCYMIYYAFSRFIPLDTIIEQKRLLKLQQGPMISLIIYFVITVFLFIILAKKIKKGKNNEKNLFIFIMLFSIPFLYTFERANIIFVALILLMTFFAFRNSENKILKEISLISLAASAAIKIYPALFGLILLKEKKWKEIIRVIIYGLILFFVPFIFFGGFECILEFYRNITGATNSFNETFVINKINFMAAIDNINSILQISNQHLDMANKIFVGLLILTSIISSFTMKNNWKLLSLLTCLMIGIPGISFTYTAIFFVLPLIYFIDDKSKKNIFDYIYLILFILIMFANPLAIFENGTFDYFYNNISLNTKVMSISILILTVLLNIENIINLIKRKYILSGIDDDTKQITKNKRVDWIDVTKGIALFLVILGHLVKFDSNLFNWIFSFHMPLFFMLSGMCCNLEKYKNIKGFLKHKFSTLIKPYFIFSVVGFIICLFIPKWRISALSLETLKQLLYNAQPELLHVGQIWFLVALFFSNILFYIIEKKLFNKSNKYLKIIFYIMLAIVGYKIYGWINIPYFGRLPWKIDVSITATIFLALGYYIKKIDLIEKIGISKLNIVIILWLLFINILFGTILNGYVNICNCDYGNFILYYFSAISGCIIFCLLGYKLQKMKLLSYYGKNSLSMFSIHSMFLSLSEFVLYLIYNKNYYIMQNIPIKICIIIAICIYLLLIPIPKIYDFLTKKNNNIFKFRQNNKVKE